MRTSPSPLTGWPSALTTPASPCQFGKETPAAVQRTSHTRRRLRKGLVWSIQWYTKRRARRRSQQLLWEVAATAAERSLVSQPLLATGPVEDLADW